MATSGSEAFKWEEAYTEGINIRAVLQEDEGGSVEDAIHKLIMEEKRQRRRKERPAKVRLGMMRHVYIGIDLSATMLSKDFEPTRLRASLDCLATFMDKFFELNPLSTMGIIAGKEKRSERICGFTSNTQTLKEALLNINELNCVGEFSLYSMLEAALHSFQNLPAHSSKECLLIISSLTTVDAASLKQIFEQLKMRSIRCSVISFSAEIFAFKKLCTTTQGKYGVALDKEHLALLLDEHVQSPPIKKGGPGHQDSIVKMGFPQRRRVMEPSFCACHELYGESSSLANSNSQDGGEIARAFFCPQCGARYCQTPAQCRICGLFLLTAPQLARAHQQLEPLPAFEESIPGEGVACFACDESLPAASSKSYKCKLCQAQFCIDCDVLLHESLQVCPSCG